MSKVAGYWRTAAVICHCRRSESAWRVDATRRWTQSCACIGCCKTWAKPGRCELKRVELKNQQPAGGRHLPISGFRSQQFCQRLHGSRSICSSSSSNEPAMPHSAVLSLAISAPRRPTDGSALVKKPCGP